MSIPLPAVSSATAARAYNQTAPGSEANGFGGALSRALEGVVQSGHDADAKSMQAIAGTGDLTDVVAAVSRAELALQTTTAIRDRVVQAYQDIMRMPI